MPRLRYVTVKNDINKSVIITKKEVISTNKLNYKAPEKYHATAELVDYTFINKPYPLLGIYKYLCSDVTLTGDFFYL